MPVKVRKGSGDCPWEIYNAQTGEREGCSESESAAKASARARNAASEGQSMDRERIPLRVLADTPPSAQLDADRPASRIQVAKTGRFKDRRYGDFSITAKDFDRWIRNFTGPQGGELAVDFDHGPEKRGNTEAAGWMVGLEPEGDKLWAKVEWTTPGAEAVRDRRYKFISPSIAPNYKTEKGEELGPALNGVALTNRPFLEGMAAVSLSREEAAQGITEEIVEEPRPQPSPPSDSREGMTELGNIAAALGLEEEADEAKILETIQGRPLAKVAEALELSEPDEEKILDGITDLRKRLKAAEDGQLTKPLGEIAREKGKVVLDKADHEERTRKLQRGEQAINELHEKRFSEAFNAAVHEGRAAPNSEDRFRALYDADADKTLDMLDELPRLVSTRANGSGEAFGDAPDGQHADHYHLDREIRAHMKRHNEPDYGKALEAVLAEKEMTPR